MRFIFLILIIILVSGCSKEPDINEPGVCESYGVQERGMYMGEINNVFELPDSEIQAVCGPSGWVNMSVAGCTKLHKDGTVDIYFRTGDKCTEIHERCHVLHGRYHTDRYRSDVAKGHPRPSCPP
jgi:hypothetical protein